MPNIAALLKDEISRLSRKEIRRQMGPMRKASAAHRRHIAALKREIARLEKSVAALGKRASAPAATAKDPDDGGTTPRFQARGLVSPVVLATVLERVSAHLEVMRDHPLTTRRYYKRVAY